MDLININDSKTKFVHKVKPKPTFRTSYEKEKYWDIQKKRWIEGENSLCGMHIFYLEQTKIKDRNTGDVFLPRYRDCDDWIISEMNDHFWNAKGIIGVVKRRELGLTSLGSGLLPLYTQRLFPGSTFGMTSCDKDRIFKAYNDKFNVALMGMDEDIRPEVLLKNTSKNSNVYLQFQWKSKDENGKPKISLSDFFCKETANDDNAAKGFSGTGMRAAYFDEFPLHKRRNKLIGSSRPCFMRGTEQVGFLLWAGTVEEGLTNDDITELKNIVEDSEKMRTKIIFAPAWWGLIMNDAGISDEKKGVEWVMKEREAKEGARDETEIKNFVKNYPLTLDEVLDLAGTDFFSEKVSNNLKGQLTTINEKYDKYPEDPRSIFIKEGKYESQGNNKSKIYIQEHPKEGVTYCQLVDGVGTGTKNGGEKGSNVASIIMKMFDPETLLPFQTVALYYERPETVEQSYNNITDLAEYYNRFGRFTKIAAEGAQGMADHFAEYLKKRNRYHWVQKAIDISGKGYTRIDKSFQQINQHTLDFQIREANILLTKYSHCITMKKILENLLLPSTDNADIRSAFLMFPFVLPKNFDQPPKPPVPKITYTPKLIWENTPNGMRSKRVWEKNIQDERTTI